MFLKEKKAQPWGKLGDKLKTFCGESGRYHTISMKHIMSLFCSEVKPIESLCFI